MPNIYSRSRSKPYLVLCLQMPQFMKNTHCSWHLCGWPLRGQVGVTWGGGGGGLQEKRTFSYLLWVPERTCARCELIDLGWTLCPPRALVCFRCFSVNEIFYSLLQSIVKSCNVIKLLCVLSWNGIYIKLLECFSCL